MLVLKIIGVVIVLYVLYNIACAGLGIVAMLLGALFGKGDK